MVRLLARLLVLVALLAPGLARADAFSSTAPSPPGVANVNGQVQTQAYDGTIQFSFGIVPGATEYWNGLGGLTGTGGTLYATNGNPAGGGSVNGNFVTQGAGSFFFATGAGVALKIADPGAAVTNSFTLTPGVSGTSPKLSSPVNAQLDGSSGSITGASGFGAVLSYGGVTQVVGAPIGSGTPGTGFVQLGGSSGDSSGHMSCLGATNTGCFLAANGTGNVTLANSSGNHIVVANSVSNTAADSFLMRASATTHPLIVAGSAGTSVAVGSGSLATTATTGFLMIPFGAGAPTGVPALTVDGVSMYFDTTNIKLCIYTGSAWKCSAAFT